jgi:predicted N-acetyltransferase YhbS
MIIRSEKPSDIEAIAEVTRLAFEDHPLLYSKIF